MVRCTRSVSLVRHPARTPANRVQAAGGLEPHFLPLQGRACGKGHASSNTEDSGEGGLQGNGGRDARPSTSRDAAASLADAPSQEGRVSPARGPWSRVSQPVLAAELALPARKRRSARRCARPHTHTQEGAAARGLALALPAGWGCPQLGHQQRLPFAQHLPAGSLDGERRHSPESSRRTETPDTRHPRHRGHGGQGPGTPQCSALTRMGSARPTHTGLCAGSDL